MSTSDKIKSEIFNTSVKKMPRMKKIIWLRMKSMMSKLIRVLETNFSSPLGGGRAWKVRFGKRK